MTKDSAKRLTTLREHAFKLDGSDDWCVPEPYVKQVLAEAGVTVPTGRIVAAKAGAASAGADLREPMVLKAWGGGIVHKSELGAVRVGVGKSALDKAGDDMLAAVASHGIVGARLFVEEMAPKGVEVLFGVISRPPFGPLAILGGGGAQAELFGDPVVRLCPLTRQSAAEMIDAFKGAPLLKGYRGSAKADIEGLIDTMVAIAGAGGVVESLGGAFSEFECNPLFVGEHGVVAADARLTLHSPAASQPPAAKPPVDIAALMNPKSVAVVGASATKPNSWGGRTLARYRKLGWSENLYAVHPTAQIEDYPTYKTLGDIPGGVDYVEISVGAEATPEVMRAAKGKAKTAVITAAGFRESGPEGEALERDLIAAAAEGGVRYVGPNCMGIYSPRARHGYSGAEANEPGRIGGVFQSGGLATDAIQIGATMGLRFSSIVSAGNASDIKPSDIFGYLLNDPNTEIIAFHVEGGADERLIQLLRQAAGVKPVVLLAPGLSATGARVAASHTGAMTSERRGWQAVSQATGLTVTETLEEFLAALLFLDRNMERLTDDSGTVLVVGLGGGASVLAADACDAQGLSVPALSEELQASLGDKRGGILLNPLDIRMGPAGPPATGRNAIDQVLAVQPFSDVLIHVNAMGYAMSQLATRLPGVEHFRGVVDALSAAPVPTCRIALVVRNMAQTPGKYTDEIWAIAKESPIPIFERLPDAAAAIAAANRFARHRRMRSA